MVLAELGGKLRESIRKLSSSTKVDEKQLNGLLGDIARALIESDVNVKLVMQVRDNIKKKLAPLLSEQDQDKLNVPKLVQTAVVDELTALLTPTTKKAYAMRRGKPNIILFVGLQGAGKTTTIAKFASYYQKRNWKTAMVCADTFRAGAFDQLKQNATKLRIPFYGSYTEADPVEIAQLGVNQFVKSSYEVILVDTSGRHKQEASLLEEMQEISHAVHPNNTVFVMDATQGQAVFDQALAFHQAVDVGSVIVTKLDGHAKGGGALSAVAATDSPILFLGSGEHFDDLETFHASSFVNKLLGYGDMRGFMEEMKSMQDDGTSKEQMLEKMQKGEFTLRDMYSQFQKTMGMGSMSKVMGSIMPGMPEHLIPKDGQDATSKQLRKFMVMMDSMTNAELDGKFDFHSKKTNPADVQSRIRRIARGSGCHPKEVQMLLQQHQQLQGVMAKMGKNMGKDGLKKQAMLQQQMKKNPKAVMQQINQMDPKVLQQMGGRDAVIAMLKGGGGSGAGGGADAHQAAMEAMMGGMGGMGGGAMPGGMPSMPAGMDMGKLMAMAQQMGLGGMMGGAGGGGMPGGMPSGMEMEKMLAGMDKEKMMAMAQQMGLGGMMGGGGGMPPPNMGGRR
jgi:signal recognition particle subunit SRP54